MWCATNSIPCKAESKLGTPTLLFERGRVCCSDVPGGCSTHFTSLIDLLAAFCADVTPRKPMEGKAMVLYDFQGADEQELTVFQGQEVRRL